MRTATPEDSQNHINRRLLNCLRWHCLHEKLHMKTRFLKTGLCVITVLLAFACSDEESSKSYDFSPKKGAPGTIVTFTSKNDNFSFSDWNAHFNGTAQPSRVISRSAKELQVEVPADAISGKIGLAPSTGGSMFYESHQSVFVVK